MRNNAAWCLGLVAVCFASPLRAEAIDITRCQALDQPDTTYRLLNDVTADHTCFFFKARGITLDGNNKTVRYDNSPKILIPNNGFEEGVGTSANNWTLPPNAKRLEGSFSNPVEVTQGRYSIRFEAPMPPQAMVSQGTITLPGGHTVVVSMLVYVRLANITFTLDVLDASTQVVLASGTLQGGVTNHSPKPLLTEYKGVAPRAVKLRLSVSGAGLASTGTFFVDDAKARWASPNGIFAGACYSYDAYEKDCGGGRPDDFVVKNITIRQGTDAGYAADAIRFSQGIAGAVGEVANVETHVHGDESSNFSISGSLGVSIHDSRFYNTTRYVYKRDNLPAVISVSGVNGIGKHLITRNRIVGGPEIGILVTNSPGTEVSYNDVSQASWYTNDFAISIHAIPFSANATLVHHNVIHPFNGRGIHMHHSSNLEVFANRITVTERRNRNQEYTPCEIGGAWGIQQEEGVANRIYDNEVLLEDPEGCGGGAFRASGLAAEDDLIVRNNTFTVSTIEKPANSAAAVSVYGDGRGMRFFDNRLISNDILIAVGWGGFQNGLLGPNNVFQRPAASIDGAVDVEFRNASPADLIILDPQVVAPAELSRVSIQRKSTDGGWPAPAELRIKRTTTIRLISERQTPVRDTTVTISDNDDALVASGKTDAEGELSAAISVSKIFNTSAKGYNYQSFFPYKAAAPAFTAVRSFQEQELPTISMFLGDAPPNPPGNLRLE